MQQFGNEATGLQGAASAVDSTYSIHRSELVRFRNLHSFCVGPLICQPDSWLLVKVWMNFSWLGLQVALCAALLL